MIRVDKSDRKKKPPRCEVKLDGLPPELAEIPRWVTWKWEWRDGSEGKSGKYTKPLMDPKSGKYAEANNPKTWATFPEAMHAYRTNKSFDGIGFVFTDEDDIMGIDIDGCINPDGTLTAVGQQAVEHFGTSYCEISPSGTGLKFIIRGNLPCEKEGRKNTNLDVEAYQSGRYFTLTGRTWQGQKNPVVYLQRELKAWFKLVFLSAKSDDKTDRTPSAPVSATVQAVVDKAKTARNGDKFLRLFNGDTSEHGDDSSSADLALCSQLAFWCGRDARLMDECFRQSGLYREKWERDDYRQNTIQKAIDGCNETYEWDRQAGRQSFVSIESCTADPESDEWPDLIPISGPDPVPMVPSDFPPSVAPIVEAVARMAEVPAELPGLMALGVLATASQKKFEIASSGSHKEPLNLFVCPAMAPGERKTAVVTIVTKPLRRWENEERARLAPVIREAESERRTQEKRIENLRTRAAKSEDPTERADLQREIDTIERDLPPVASLPILITDDCTPEHAATLLRQQGEKLAIISDEGGIFDIVAGRYSRGVPNLDVFLQGHAGSPVRVHRGSREPVDLQSPALTVAVSCQPFVLNEMGENKAFRGRGLLARFLFAVPQSRLGFRTLESHEIPATVTDRWERIVCAMLNFPQQEDEYGNPVAQTIVLSPEALRLWKHEQQVTELEMRPGQVWSANTGWASKYPGAVLRIAGVLHCATCAEKQVSPAAVRVHETTMQAAVTIGRKLKSHSLRAFGMMALSEEQKDAIRIVEWIRRDGITEFTGRECSIHCNSAGRVKDLEPAFELLANHGWIRLGRKRQPEGGGRPSQPFEVNPAVAKLDDKSDVTPPMDESEPVLSVSSSVSAQAVLITPAVEDEWNFDFPSDTRRSRP